MSFDHAQHQNRGSSGNREPLEDLPQDGQSSSSGESSCENFDLSVSDSEDGDEACDEETRFELLSAYLDDEVTVEERQMVTQWLMDDPNSQEMYQRLLMLRQAIRTAPVPVQPPLQVPSASQRPWRVLSAWKLHRALLFLIAIALLSSLGQWVTLGGRQQLQEAWQFIRTLPQGKSVIDLASTVNELSFKATKSTF